MSKSMLLLSSGHTVFAACVLLAYAMHPQAAHAQSPSPGASPAPPIHHTLHHVPAHAGRETHERKVFGQFTGFASPAEALAHHTEHHHAQRIALVSGSVTHKNGKKVSETVTVSVGSGVAGSGAAAAHNVVSAHLQMDEAQECIESVTDYLTLLRREEQTGRHTTHHLQHQLHDGLRVTYDESKTGFVFSVAVGPEGETVCETTSEADMEAFHHALTNAFHWVKSR